MSSYLNVAHAVLENKKFIPQDKNTARGKKEKQQTCCVSLEIFLSHPFLNLNKEGIGPVVPSRSMM